MTHAVVTGGSGFIGTNLCFSLLRRGYTVTALDNLITSSEKNIRALSEFPMFRFIRHDITMPLPSVFAKSQKKKKEIYHLACPTGVPNIKRFGEEMLMSCSIGTRNVLELARTHGARLLFTSSSEVYGDPLVSPQREEYTGNVDTLGYRSPYEEGKRFSESLVAEYVKKYRIHAVIVRVFNTYGPYMDKGDDRVIPQFILRAKAGKPLAVHGDGSQTRTFCYVDDLVAGLELVIKKGKKGSVYNLGSDKRTAIRDLAQRVIDETKSPSSIRYTKRPAHDHASRLPDLTKIRKLGWHPQTTLRVGIRKTIRWGEEADK